jgi:hypothetical protein
VTRPRKPAPGSNVIRRSCSWCSRLNVVGSVVYGEDVISPTTCAGCGHRGDVAMSLCTCSACREPAPPLTEADVAEALATLDRLAESRRKRQGGAL